MRKHMNFSPFKKPSSNDVIEKIFSVFNEEELSSLTNEEVFDAKSSMRNISFALVPKYPSCCNYKKRITKFVEPFRTSKTTLSHQTLEVYSFKKLLVEQFFDYAEGDLIKQEAIDIISREWDAFVTNTDNKRWAKFSGENIKMFLNYGLNDCFFPFTTNRLAFKIALKEFLENIDIFGSSFIELLVNMMSQLFVRYAI